MSNQPAVRDYPTFPNKPVIVPSPCDMLSRDDCQRHDTRDFFGTSENVFEKFVCTRWIDNTYLWSAAAQKKSHYYI